MRSIFRSAGAAISNLIHGKAEERAAQAANLLRSHLLVSLANSPARTGRKYRIPGTNKMYTASAPGEYPALRTGKLRGAVAKAGVNVVRTFGGVRAELGVGVPEYGYHLERGLRPWFSRAAAEKRQEMQAAVGRRWF
jgi:hypothetical protein